VEPLIRVSDDSDRPAIQRLTTMLAFLEGHAAEEVPSTCFVAVENDIVGFCAVDKHAPHAARLVSLYVSGGWRRQGIGRRLTRFAIENLTPGTELSVLVAPSSPALTLFQKLGFAAVTHLGEYQTPGDDLHLALKIV
jgi:ribosomal protein S18 acetylase RimI-like enzyme